MQHIFRSLPVVFKDIDGGEFANEAVIFAAWRKIAGESLGNHAVPFKLIKKKLFVAVSDNNWRRQIEDLSSQMIFKLNSALGSSLVTFIEFKIDAAIVKNARQTAAIETSAAEANAIAKKEITSGLLQAAKAIADEKLRESFLLAAGSGLARKKQIGITES
ncbi:MAG: DciA family protein [Pyrinomonadaceae bacterium]